jgi:hypothetical protein
MEVMYLIWVICWGPGSVLSLESLGEWVETSGTR